MARIPDEVTLEDVERALQASSQSVYIYVGDEKDDGWTAVQEVKEAFSSLEIFRVDERDKEAVAHWLETEPLLEDNHVEDPVGIVFGYGEVPWVFLSWDQASHPKKLQKWLRRAEQGT